MNTTLLGAFVAGVLTLLSPCSVMLLPAFFSYAFTSPARLLARTGVFYLGLATTLVPIGVLAGSFGAYVNEHRSALVAAASWVVIGLGALMLAGVRVPMPASADGGRDDATSAASVYALGTVYGLAGVCAGPLLGAVLAMAAVGSSAAYGGVVLLVFAAGMVLPLVVLSLAWDRLAAGQAPGPPPWGAGGPLVQHLDRHRRGCAHDRGRGAAAVDRRHRGDRRGVEHRGPVPARTVGVGADRWGARHRVRRRGGGRAGVGVGGPAAAPAPAAGRTGP